MPVTTGMTLQFLLAHRNQNLQRLQFPQKIFHLKGGETINAGWCSNPHYCQTKKGTP